MRGKPLFEGEEGKRRRHNPAVGLRHPWPTELVRIETNVPVGRTKFPLPQPVGLTTFGLKQPALPPIDHGSVNSSTLKGPEIERCRPGSFTIAAFNLRPTPVRLLPADHYPKTTVFYFVFFRPQL